MWPLYIGSNGQIRKSIPFSVMVAGFLAYPAHSLCRFLHLSRMDGAYARARWVLRPAHPKKGAAHVYFVRRVRILLDHPPSVPGISECMVPKGQEAGTPPSKSGLAGAIRWAATGCMHTPGRYARCQPARGHRDKLMYGGRC
jgi:hypothetical protein